MQTKEFIEKVLRINPDIIYTSPYTRTQETAQIIQTIFKDYLNKEVEIKVDESLENLEASSD